ncbi:MAG: hypothetical protein H0X62_11190 [Bacteroidetes bacterium]|nr:hypothetical protein [Bacteroidota bacterium]
MNKKGNITRTQPLEWNTMLGFAQRLKNNKQYKDYLLILCGSYFGLRISDLLRIKYQDVVKCLLINWLINSDLNHLLLINHFF